MFEKFKTQNATYEDGDGVIVVSGQYIQKEFMEPQFYLLEKGSIFETH